jgi:formate hydrogenlyase transcriptional activator
VNGSLFRLGEAHVCGLEEGYWGSVMEKTDRNLSIEGARAEDKFKEIIGNSAALKFVLTEVQRVALTDSTVLILGETGTGKERIAEAIHKASTRHDRPFIKLNCAAIPFDLLESELFGHERGAFTGAVAQKIGRFEMADTGTLFLDEIGDLPLALQPKLLRVLQEQEFERLGSGKTHHINVRLVAATHRNLSELVARQQFRSDLYYRLNVFPIVLPPLRERREDIALLVSHFVEVFARRMGKQIGSIQKETLHAFTSYSWPGNVRELQNLIERAVILSEKGVLENPFSTLDANPAGTPTTNTNFVVLPSAQEGTFRDSQRALILRALHASAWMVGGSRGAAARLGLKRTTLISKMKKLGISRPVPQVEVAGLNQNREPDRPWQPAAD